MIRKTLAGLVAFIVLMMASATVASAAPNDDPDGTGEAGATTSVVTNTVVTRTTETITVSGTSATQSSETPTETPESSEGSIEVSGTQATQQSGEQTSSSSQAIEVLPTESTQKASLKHTAYTGVSFNVPLTITIAALIVLFGFALTVLGGRGVLRHRRQH